MKTSETVKELFAAMSKAQGEIRGAVKDSANPFFKSKYADLASVMDAIREPFAKNGLCYIQSVASTPEGHPVVTTRIAHSSGEWAEDSVMVPLAKIGAQEIGSAITYMRRYGLSAMAGVAQVDDDGNVAQSASPITATAAVHDALSSLPTESRETVEGLADTINEAMKDAQRAAPWVVSHLEGLDLSMEEKLGLWALLDSKVRSALKKEMESRKKAKEVA